MRNSKKIFIGVIFFIILIISSIFFYSSKIENYQNLKSCLIYGEAIHIESSTNIYMSNNKINYNCDVNPTKNVFVEIVSLFGIILGICVNMILIYSFTIKQDIK